MQGVLSFLQGFADAILSVFDFFFALFEDTITFFKLIAKMPVYVAKALSWIPAEFYVGIGVLFTIVILYKILGREG